MKERAPVRVLVVDDDPRVRRTLADVLATDDGLEVVAEAADGRAALAQVRTHAPDVVVLDVRMPVLDGIGVLRELRHEPRRVPVLVLTAFGEVQHVRDAIGLGVGGFWLKSDDPRDLLRAVRGVAAGETWLSPAVARMVTSELRRGLDAAEGARATRERLAALTPRERSVVDLVARGRTNAEVAAALHLAESTVKANVSAALDRLGLRNRVELAWLVWVAGSPTEDD